MSLKVSIVTPVLNAVKTIEDSILSVLSQTYYNIEHIIVDGGSTDGTLAIVQRYSNKIACIISEPDSGLYDAANKGIMRATGDLIGILNADDVYSNKNVICLIVDAFKREKVDVVYGNLVYVSDDNLQKIVRYYNSASFKVEQFARGMMPAHPTFYTYKRCYENYGLYKTDYLIAADFELLLRFLKTYEASFFFLSLVFVKMRVGGISNRGLKSNYLLNKEIFRACAENGIHTNMLKIWSKYFLKLFQLVQRPDWQDVNKSRH